MGIGFWSDLPTRGVTAAEVAAVLPEGAARDMDEAVRAFGRLTDVTPAGDSDGGGSPRKRGRGPAEPLKDLLVRGRTFHRLALDGVVEEVWSRTDTVRTDTLPENPTVETWVLATREVGPNGQVGEIAGVRPDGERYYLGDDGREVTLSARDRADALDGLESADFDEVDAAVERGKKSALMSIPGVGEDEAAALFDAGFETPNDLKGVAGDEIATISGINVETAGEIHRALSQSSDDYPNRNQLDGPTKTYDLVDAATGDGGPDPRQSDEDTLADFEDELDDADDMAVVLGAMSDVTTEFSAGADHFTIRFEGHLAHRDAQRVDADPQSAFESCEDATEVRAEGMGDERAGIDLSIEFQITDPYRAEELVAAAEGEPTSVKAADGVPFPITDMEYDVAKHAVPEGGRYHSTVSIGDVTAEVEDVSIKIENAKERLKSHIKGADGGE